MENELPAAMESSVDVVLPKRIRPKTDTLDP
jgi:hypothetical protein